MTWSDIFFSFRGRINRARYWLTALAYVAAIAVFFAIVASSALSARPANGGVATVFILFGVLYIGLGYSALAVAVKRLHDREKSAWWLIVFYLLPGVLGGVGQAMQNSAVGFVFALAGFATSIWALVELGFLRGTVGPNRYGADPVGV